LAWLSAEAHDIECIIRSFVHAPRSDLRLCVAEAQQLVTVPRDIMLVTCDVSVASKGQAVVCTLQPTPPDNSLAINRTRNVCLTSLFQPCLPLGTASRDARISSGRCRLILCPFQRPLVAFPALQVTFCGALQSLTSCLSLGGDVLALHIVLCGVLSGVLAADPLGRLVCRLGLPCIRV